MKRLKAKEYLMQIQKLNKIIDCKLAEIEALRCRAESITIALKPDKIQTSGTTDAISECVAQIIVLEAEIKKSVQQSMELIRECAQIIDTLEADYSLILYKRYFQNEKWEQIAYEMNISYQWVCVLHGRALQKVQAIIDAKNHCLLDKN